MKKLFLVLTLAGAGCSARGYDPEASRAFRAAWEKRRAGDEAGYRAALAEVAKKRGTWAGDRAAVDLELMDEPRSSGWTPLLSRVSGWLKGHSTTPVPGEPSQL